MKVRKHRNEGVNIVKPLAIWKGIPHPAAAKHIMDMITTVAVRVIENILC
jgi:hypothetical protein